MDLFWGGMVGLVHEIDIPQVACRLTQMSHDSAVWAIFSCPERCLRSRKRT